MSPFQFGLIKPTSRRELRLLELNYRVDRYFHSWQNNSWQNSAATIAAFPSELDSIAVLLFRSDYQLRTTPLSATQLALFQWFRDGTSVAEVLQYSQLTAAEVRRQLLLWPAAGLFIAE